MKYDFKKAKLFIEQNKENIKEASLGMHEDWFWTAETIFEDGEYKVNLDDKDLTIGGISGSYWATPVMQVEYKDGTIKTYYCHDDGEQGIMRPEVAIALGGAITTEVQTMRNNIELEEIYDDEEEIYDDEE